MASHPPVSDLTAHLGFWMRAVSNHVSHAFAAKLTARDVTVAEWAVMRTLYGSAAMPPSRVAEKMAMTRGAITRLADRLIAKGLLVRKASPNDGRAQTLALTARGTALVPELAALADLNDAEFFGTLSTAERRALERTLKRMIARANITAVPVD